MNLDLPSLYVASFTTFTLITIAMVLMGWRYPQEKALRIWGMAGVLASTGTLLLSLRTVLPPALVIYSGNILLFCAQTGCWFGIVALSGAPLPWRKGLSILALACLLFLQVPTDQAHLSYRVQLFSVLYLLYSTLCLHDLWRNKNSKLLGYRLSMLVILLLTLTYLARLVYAVQYSGNGLVLKGMFAYINFQVIWLEYAKMLFFIYICFESLENRLYQQAMHDSLTRLPNRRAFHERAEQRLADVANMPVALLLMDLDWFKRVNDTYGHLAGDDVLIHFATLLARQFGQTDAVYGRNGGEEFVILLSGEAANHARLLADELRQQLVSQPIRSSEGTLIRQSVSIGIAVSQQATTLRELFTHADMALYQAKEQGRNRVCLLEN